MYTRRTKLNNIEFAWLVNPTDKSKLFAYMRQYHQETTKEINYSIPPACILRLAPSFLCSWQVFDMQNKTLMTKHILGDEHYFGAPDQI